MHSGIKLFSFLFSIQSKIIGEPTELVLDVICHFPVTLANGDASTRVFKKNLGRYFFSSRDLLGGSLASLLTSELTSLASIRNLKKKTKEIDMYSNLSMYLNVCLSLRQWCPSASFPCGQPPAPILISFKSTRETPMLSVKSDVFAYARVSVL